jgi:hypothetical protein
VRIVPTFIAALGGHAAVIEALDRLGADENRAHNDTDGWTPLRIATLSIAVQHSAAQGSHSRPHGGGGRAPVARGGGIVT